METERGADDQDLKWFPKPKQKKNGSKVLNYCWILFRGSWAAGNRAESGYTLDRATSQENQPFTLHHPYLCPFRGFSLTNPHVFGLTYLQKKKYKRHTERALIITGNQTDDLPAERPPDGLWLICITWGLYLKNCRLSHGPRRISNV